MQIHFKYYTTALARKNPPAPAAQKNCRGGMGGVEVMSSETVSKGGGGGGEGLRLGEEGSLTHSPTM